MNTLPQPEDLVHRGPPTDPFTGLTVGIMPTLLSLEQSLRANSIAQNAQLLRAYIDTYASLERHLMNYYDRTQSLPDYQIPHRESMITPTRQHINTLCMMLRYN